MPIKFPCRFVAKDRLFASVSFGKEHQMSAKSWCDYSGGDVEQQIDMVSGVAFAANVYCQLGFEPVGW